MLLHGAPSYREFMGYLLLDDLRANALSLMSVTLSAAVTVRPCLTLYINVTDVMILISTVPFAQSAWLHKRETLQISVKSRFCSVGRASGYSNG